MALPQRHPIEAKGLTYGSVDLRNLQYRKAINCLRRQPCSPACSTSPRWEIALAS